MNDKQYTGIFSLPRRAALAFIAFLTIAGPNVASLAQNTAKVIGTTDATAESKIVKGAAFRVGAWSGAPEAQAIAGLFRDALESACYQVGGSSDFGKGSVLSFQFYG